MTKKDEFVQEAEFSELPEAELDTPTEEHAVQFEPLNVRVILVNGNNLEFTIRDIPNSQKGYMEWIKAVVKSKEEDGFFIGSYFIQDAKIQVFERIG